LKIETVQAKVTTNLQPRKKRQVGMSAKGMAHIMHLLTNLYNDRELAVIREYYTNGLDAHTMVGNTNPVLITLPTWDKPNYVVQDGGVGMSEDTLFEVYGEYGESTGRDSDDIVGGFGMGSKSAYTIATQFTVISVKDGWKTTALFSKQAFGAYDVDIVNSVQTTDSNGTLVSIPISSNLNMFNDKARKFFAFSEPGSVLVDGKAPDYALATAERLVNPKDPDMMVFVRPKTSGDSFVIMGNVPYVLSYSEIKASLDRLGVAASESFTRMPKFFRIPIGSVDLSPNREGIQMTDKSNDLIDSYMSFIVNDLQEIALKELDQCENLEDFFKTHKRWNEMITVPRLFKGEPVPTELELKTASRQIYKTSYSHASHTETNWATLNVGNSRIIVTGYAADQYKKVNNYLTPYMAAEGLNSATFIITDDKEFPNNKWVKMSGRFATITGDELIEIGRAQRKKERQEAAKLNGSSKKSKIKYPVMFVDEQEIRWVEHDEIDQKTPYLQTTDLIGRMNEFIKTIYKRLNYTQVFSESLASYMELVTDEKEIILLGGSRTIKALEQRVKETRPLIEDIKGAVGKIDTVITPELVRHALVSESYWKRFFQNAGIEDMVKDIKDPDIIEIITPSASTLDAYEKYDTVVNAFEYLRYPGMPNVRKIDTSKDNILKKLDQKYPLIDALNAWNLKKRGVTHLVKYFNLIHEESQPASNMVISGNKISN
jgi:glutaredoxin